MSRIVLQSTEVGQWRELVSEAASACSRPLDEDLESYLVFLLMRFVGRSDMAGSVLALEYLQGLTQAGNRRFQQLRDVGDQCLLYSGLFPLRARRRLVRIRYYVDLGRGAYHQLSDQMQHSWAQTFERLARQFVLLMDVLQAMRELQATASVDPMLLHELSTECDSDRAATRLEEQFGHRWMEPGNDNRH